MRIAITREVSSAIDRCALLHVEREPLDVERARAQHRRYEQTLVELGCKVLAQPEAPELPDSVFVEDNAVVFDELAVIARSGAPGRRPETRVVEDALAPYRACERLEAPATLDGGDVLCVGSTVFVGRSTRSNGAASDRLRTLLEPWGYEVREVAVNDCLHLKSAVTRVEASTLLINPSWLDLGPFDDLDLLEVDPQEPFGANALMIGDTVVYSTLYPRTRDRLVDRGIEVVEVDLSELAKAEGGVTCCSIVFEG